MHTPNIPPHTLTTPHPLHSFCTHDGPYLPVHTQQQLSGNYQQHMHYTPTPHPSMYKPLLHTTNKHMQTHSWQNGTRCRDGVNVLWCRSHLVWLVFEGSIPTCACFHSENFFVTCMKCKWISQLMLFSVFDSAGIHLSSRQTCKQR